MKRWKAIHEYLTAMPLRSRKEMFKEFRLAHSNWREPTFAVLERIVVRLERQVDVCLEQNVRKQALNRSVRHYRTFILQRKYFNHATSKRTNDVKNKMDKA